jgi:hypothetical protein
VGRIVTDGLLVRACVDIIVDHASVSLFIDRIPNLLVAFPHISYLFCLFTPILGVFPTRDRLGPSLSEID